MPATVVETTASLSPSDGSAPPTAVNSFTRYPSSRDDDAKLRSLLKIREPASVSFVEFREPFRVALDSLYTGLYFNSSLEPVRAADPSNRPVRSVLLDWRPKRWYREHKALADAIRMAQLDVRRGNTELEVLENDGAYPGDVDRIAHEERIRTARRRYFESQNVLEGMIEERNALIQEMRRSGYSLRSSKVPTYITDLGFNFCIVGGLSGYRDFTPLYVPSGADLKDDTAWKDLEQALRERLFANKWFSSKARERYLARLAPLESQASYLPLIQTELGALDQELILLDSQLAQVTKQIEDVSVTIASWTADRQLLANGQLMFRPHRGEEYPIGGGGPGPENNSKFKTWLSENFAAFKAFRYELEVTGSDYSLAISVYPDSEWRQDYRVNVSAFAIEVFHPYNPIETIMHGGAPGWIERVGTRYEYRYSIGGDPEILNFFDTALRLCDRFTNQSLPQKAVELETRSATLKNNRAGVGLRRTDLESSALRRAREEFLDAWNRPDAVETKPTEAGVVHPHADPLVDLLVELESEGEPIRVYELEFRSDGYYTRDGQSLLDFARTAARFPHLPVLLAPVFDRDGKRLLDVSNALVGPQRSTRAIRVPTVTFVETYQAEVRWGGYCLGELTQTISLFPGETKDLVIQQATRLVRKTARTEAEESEIARTDTASFEESLAEELSAKNQSALSQTQEEKRSRKDTAKHAVSDSVEREDSASVSAGLSGGTNTTDSREGSYTKKDEDEEGTIKGSRQRNRNVQAGISAELSSTTTTAHKDERVDALEISQNQTNSTTSQESRESFKKSVSNAVRRTASEVSSKNKVSVNVSSSTDSEESMTRTETLRIENPNVGRTINYHLFQLQNVYETTLNLIDVKIVVDPGIEIIKSSELADVRVFNLEEFGRIYFNCDGSDPRIALLATTVARHVFRNYCDLERTDPKHREALISTDVLPFDTELLRVLNLSSSGWESGEPVAADVIDELRNALTYLKSRSFRFRRVEALSKQTETINTGSFYMDSEVGMQPATEKYLEERRDIETERQKAEVEEIRARIQAGVFQSKWPTGLTSLTLGQGPGTGELLPTPSKPPQGSGG